jgi:hypothetical protein
MGSSAVTLSMLAAPGDVRDVRAGPPGDDAAGLRNAQCARTSLCRPAKPSLAGLNRLSRW